MNLRSARLLPTALAAATALCFAGTPVRAQESAPASTAASVDDSLYVALGRQPGVVALVDDFVPRLAADERMSLFFKHVEQTHFKEMLSLEFCEVSGGGCIYTGKTTKAAHENMDISKADFNALVEVLQQAMDARGIPFATQNRLLARLAPLHREIVSQH